MIIRYLYKGGIETASKEKITELMRMFLTYKIATELPGDFIRKISDEEYEKFFQSNLIVKDNAIMTFEMFKTAFEKKVIESEKETVEEIVGIATNRLPHLAKLSDIEIDRMIAILNTPEGYAIREMIQFLLENIGIIMHERADKIGSSCYDVFVELVNLNEKTVSGKTKSPEMN